MSRERTQPALDIIKLIAIVLVIFSSALPYGESFAGGYSSFIDLNQTDLSFKHILFTCMRYCGQIGDTLFIAVSAWFLSDSLKFKVYKVIHIVFDTWIISFLGLIIASRFLDLTIRDILHSLFPIKYNVNWFVGCYILYYMIHPMLNRAVNGLGRRPLLILVSMLFLMYSVISTVEKSYYYTNLIGFVSLHYFVMFYKRYIYGKNVKTYAKLTLICSIAGILFWICLINLLGEQYAKFSDKNLFGCVFMNPLIISMAISLLDIGVHCKKCNGANINRILYVTKYSLLVYLIHANYYWLSNGKYFLYDNLNKHGVDLLESLFVVIILYCVGSLSIAFLYDKLFGKIVDNVAKHGARIVDTVVNNIED